MFSSYRDEGTYIQRCVYLMLPEDVKITNSVLNNCIDGTEELREDKQLYLTHHIAKISLLSYMVE